MDGVRSSKTVDGVVHNYVTLNGKVVQESYGDVVKVFTDDTASNPYTMQVSSDGGNNFSTFYYVLNAQGDVIHVLNWNREVCANYIYDAWGKILFASGPSAAGNPLRYRGYYYDYETGFYYLQSRYYDPEIGRFISADIYPTTGQDFTGNNMFVYCGNNPVIRVDKIGEFWNLAAGAIIGAVISTVSHIAANVVSREKWSDDVLTAAATGAASGALSATGFGKVAQAVGNAAISFIGEASNQIGARTFGTKEGTLALLKATGSGAIGGLIGGNGMRHKTGNYYKAAQSARATALKVFGKTYRNPNTPAKLISRATNMVRTVGRKESQITGVKFILGSINAQLLTRI